MKVGEDLRAARATTCGRSAASPRMRRSIEVPDPNNRVELRYQSAERRSEVLSGGRAAVDLDWA